MSSKAYLRAAMLRDFAAALVQQSASAPGLIILCQPRQKLPAGLS
jgi:hypothetical protein